MSVDLTTLFGPQGFKANQQPAESTPYTPSTLPPGTPLQAQPVAAPIPPQQHEFTPPAPAHPSASVVIGVPLEGTVTGTVELPPHMRPSTEPYDPRTDHLGRPLPQGIQRDAYGNGYTDIRNPEHPVAVEFESWLAPKEAPKSENRGRGRPPKYQRHPGESDEAYKKRVRSQSNQRQYIRRAKTTTIDIPDAGSVNFSTQPGPLAVELITQFLQRKVEFERGVSQFRQYVKEQTEMFEQLRARIQYLKDTNQ